MHGGLLAASELNKGQTLFQDMCDRLQRGEYGQQSELTLIACKYNLEIIVLENGTQQWIQKPKGTRKHTIYYFVKKTKYRVCFKTLILNQIQFQFQP
jgi:hypothetical protein